MNDAELLSLFESQSISNEDWSHEYHVRVAFIYLSKQSFDEALDKVKTGINKLNSVNKVPESQFRGFHETLTIGWLKLVALKMNDGQYLTSRELIQSCPELLNSRLLSEYYSSERLMSQEAKKSFMEPDLKPLDKQS